MCKYVRYCSRVCQKKAWKLHREECAYLRVLHPLVPTDTVRFMARIIIRMRRDGQNERFLMPEGDSYRAFDNLEAHVDEILADECRLNAFHAFYGVLRQCLRAETPTVADALRIYGKLVINSFNIMDSEYQSVGVGLYIVPSALDHSCAPNAAVAFDGKTIIVKCIAAYEGGFKADTRISYTNLLAPTAERRKALREQYYTFDELSFLYSFS